MSVCARCDREFNAWTLSLKGSPFGGPVVCQKCRSVATRGSKRPAAKFTEYDIVQIRKRNAAGESQKSLAREYGVTDSNINLICRRRSWRHVA